MNKLKVLVEENWHLTFEALGSSSIAWLNLHGDTVDGLDLVWVRINPSNHPLCAFCLYVAY